MSPIFNVLGSMAKDENNSGYIFGILILAIIIWIIEIYLGVWLWKVICGAIFGLPTLSFWQFFGLKLLLEILLPTITKSKED